MIRLVLGWIIITLPFQLCAAEPITPIPQSIPYNSAKAALGKKLFFDPILSKDQTISCVSCHNFAHGGADPRPVSIGVDGNKGRIQSSTVFNAVFNFTQFWNGRAKTLKDQAGGPIHNPAELGMDAAKIEDRLNGNLHYRNAFKALTGRQHILFSDVAEMIAEYEKTLITPNSRFDRFLRGELTLTPAESQGYELFKRLGCASCHNGVNIGGNSFQKFGVIIPIQRIDDTDDRYAITQREFDKNVFKVPTLRNIARTAPYFHDGSASTLKEAITTMSRHNLGIYLSSKETDTLIAFLNSLNGDIPYKATHP